MTAVIGEKPEPAAAVRTTTAATHVARTGLLFETELSRAASMAQAAHMDLGRWLVERAHVSRPEAEAALAAHFGCPFFHFVAETTLPESARLQLRPAFLKQICAVPVERRGSYAVVVMDDPGNLTSIDQLQSYVGREKLLIRVGMRDEILAFIDAAYAVTVDAPPSVVLDEGDTFVDDDPLEAETDTEIIRLANDIIAEGVHRGASDIHVEPNGAGRPVRIRLRIDGDCVELREVPAAQRRSLVARLKIMSRLDISERRKPQDGKIRLHIGSHTVELRVACYPTALGDEDVVLRILPDGKPIRLEGMRMSTTNLEAFRALIHRPYGLVLCVGPTGSGKTTTLHSALGEINRVDLKICTVEDPVEITQPGLRQVQVHPRIGLTFETALRSLLRADPDVIMIGEMRDKETAQIAVEASLTGHLVLSTLHTNTAPETVTRLVDMGLDPFTFADSLLGVLAQRLTLALCPACREACPEGGDEQRKLDEALVGVGGAPSTHPPFRPVGCPACAGKGYRGRIALHELMVADDALRIAIGRRVPIEELRRVAFAGGMRTLMQDGLDKVSEGLTDLRQVLTVCSR